MEPAGEGGPQWEWGREKETVPVADWRTQRLGRSLDDNPPPPPPHPPHPRKPQRPRFVCFCAKMPPQIQDGDPCPSPGREAGQFVKKEIHETVYQPASWLINNDRSLYKIIKLFQ